MEIITAWQNGESAELKIVGRLDSYWAEQLSGDLDRLVREGTHRLWLDLSEVIYVSSMGIGLFLRIQKQLNSLGGSLKLIRPSQPVQEILDTAKLTPILVGTPPGHPRRGATTWELRAPRRGAIAEHPRATLESFAYSEAGPLRCWTIGDPSLLPDCKFQQGHCRPLTLGTEAFAVGLGALGRDYSDCQGRFGEFLAAAGTSAYLPTDRRNVPDYLQLGETKAANVWLCYGIVFEGPFSRLTRFETRKGEEPMTLTELATLSLDQTGAAAVGMVLIAESAGLMGAALERSPIGASARDGLFAHPGIRHWMSFTAERAYRSSTTLVVGVALRGEAGPLAPLVRPIGREAQPVGHFHAAAFSHRTLQIGEIELKPTVDALFEEQNLQGVLHLLGDYREPAGLGESVFVRGACWAAPLGPISVERTSA
jgi:anti-anti-sigma factor